MQIYLQNHQIAVLNIQRKNMVNRSRIDIKMVFYKKVVISRKM